MTWTLMSYALIAVGATISSVEELISHRRTQIVLRQTTRRSVLTVSVSVLVIFASVVTLAVSLLAGSATDPSIVAMLGIQAVLLLVRWIYFQGMDGSDRMLAFAGMGMFAWAGLYASDRLPSTLAWVALAVLVGSAYLESGVSKVTQRGWRAGRQLALILNMKEFGSRLAARVLLSHPRFSAAASWGIIVVELVAAPLLLVGGWISLGIAVILTMMHLSIAVLMGLGRFFCPFVGVLCFLVATHPW